MQLESTGGTENGAAPDGIREPSRPPGVEDGVHHRRAEGESAPAPPKRRLRRREGASSRESRHEEQKVKRWRWRIRVHAIDSRAYPQFAADRDHPFVAMDANRRLREFVSCCAQLWARTCQEAARRDEAGRRAVA